MASRSVGPAGSSAADRARARPAPRWFGGADDLHAHEMQVPRVRAFHQERGAAVGQRHRLVPPPQHLRASDPHRHARPGAHPPAPGAVLQRPVPTAHPGIVGPTQMCTSGRLRPNHSTIPSSGSRQSAAGFEHDEGARSHARQPRPPSEEPLSCTQGMRAITPSRPAAVHGVWRPPHPSGTPPEWPRPQWRRPEPTSPARVEVRHARQVRRRAGRGAEPPRRGAGPRRGRPRRARAPPGSPAARHRHLTGVTAARWAAVQELLPTLWADLATHRAVVAAACAVRTRRRARLSAMGGAARAAHSAVSDVVRTWPDADARRARRPDRRRFREVAAVLEAVETVHLAALAGLGPLAERVRDARVRARDRLAPGDPAVAALAALLAARRRPARDLHERSAVAPGPAAARPRRRPRPRLDATARTATAPRRRHDSTALHAPRDAIEAWLAERSRDPRRLGGPVPPVADAVAALDPLCDREARLVARRWTASRSHASPGRPPRPALRRRLAALPAHRRGVPHRVAPPRRGRRRGGRRRARRAPAARPAWPTVGSSSPAGSPPTAPRRCGSGCPTIRTSSRLPRRSAPCWRGHGRTLRHSLPHWSPTSSG